VAITLDIASSAGGLPLTRAALGYARQLHAGQSREADGAPFILHPREVASLLYRAGAPDHLIAAGVLHDVLEKTAADAHDLRERFGSRIAQLVLAVSEDAQIVSYAARKAALRDRAAGAGEQALMLLAADKISKVRELRRLQGRTSASPPRSSRVHRTDRRRLGHYRDCLTLLQERLPSSPLVRQLDADLRKLSRATHAQRARRRRRSPTTTRPGSERGKRETL
jgi:hypothetical protein